MQIKLISHLDSEDLSAAGRMYADAAWISADDDFSFINSALAGSFLAAGAFENGRLIGMGRVLSDGVSDAYIQDVVVHPDYRNRGIGSAIVTFLVKELEKRGVDWIALVGEPGTEKFYSGLGLKAQAGYTLWKLQDS